MKNLIITVAAIVVAVLIFALYPFEPPQTPEQKADSKDREALRAIPDKSVTLSFQGSVSPGNTETEADQMKDLSGSVTMTLKAWEHFLLKQKPGMTKYEVDGESFKLEAKASSSTLSLSKTSKLTMEIINGEAPATDDYFLLQISDLYIDNDAQSLSTIRLQLHDRSGKALTSESVPKDIQLAQWNSKTLTLDRKFEDGRRRQLPRRNSKSTPESDLNQDAPKTGERRQEAVALFGQVQDLKFSVQ